MMSFKSTIRQMLEKLWDVPQIRNAMRRRASRDGEFQVRFFEDHAIAYDAGEYIGQAIEAKGHFERDVVEDVLSFLRDIKSVADRAAFVEIGANIGTQTVYFTRGTDFENVIAIEPDPRNLMLLKANLALNNINAKVLGFAVGDAEAVLEMHRDPFNSGKSSLREQNRDDVSATSDIWIDAPTVEVRVRRVDDVLSEVGQDTTDIALFWIDVEGFELNVLRGMPNALRDAAALFIEYTPYWLAEDARAEFFELLSANFNSFYVYQDGVKETTVEKLAAENEQVNILAISSSNS